MPELQVERPPQERLHDRGRQRPDVDVLLPVGDDHVDQRPGVVRLALHQGTLHLEQLPAQLLPRLAGRALCLPAELGELFEPGPVRLILDEERVVPEQRLDPLREHLAERPRHADLDREGLVFARDERRRHVVGEQRLLLRLGRPRQHVRREPLALDDPGHEPRLQPLPSQPELHPEPAVDPADLVLAVQHAVGVAVVRDPGAVAPHVRHAEQRAQPVAFLPRSDPVITAGVLRVRMPDRAALLVLQREVGSRPVDVEAQVDVLGRHGDGIAGARRQRLGGRRQEDGHHDERPDSSRHRCPRHRVNRYSRQTPAANLTMVLPTLNSTRRTNTVTPMPARISRMTRMLRNSRS